MTINLSGIQSKEVQSAPISIFDRFVAIQESALKGSKYPEGCDVMVNVMWDRDNPHQTDDEPALAVKLDNCLIGYVPVLSTIKRYIREARENNDLKRYEMHRERYRITEYIRNSIMSHLESGCVARLARVQIDEQSGKLLSVSVEFDYE